MTEDQLEQEALGWLADVGWQHRYGPDLAPDGIAPERDNYRHVLLIGRLRQAVAALNPTVPQAAREDAVKQVLDLGKPVLLAANRQFHRLPIRSVTAADVLAILDRATKLGAEVVALNLRQWSSQVFRYAVATLRADHDPASALRGAVIRSPINHSRPMDRDQIDAFLRKLQGFGDHRTTVIALRLLLTFVRTIEMRRAEWTEVDLGAAEWRVPAEKMKMRRLHIVPLSTHAVALLTELKGITGAGRWLFPIHRRPHDVMSATTVNHALMSLGFASATVTAHDFRATASTRLHEIVDSHRRRS